MYQNILFASDFSTESLVLGKKAKAFADGFGAHFSFVHIVEPPVIYMHDFSGIQKLLEEQMAHAHKTMAVFASDLELAPSDALLLTGQTKSEIIKVSKNLNVDLIILGSHGVGGYTHLLGSTAQAILQSAPCSVLTLSVCKITQAELDEERIYYARKAPFGENYTVKGLGHGKPTQTIKETLPKKEEAPKHFGSKRGIAQEVKRGPKPSFRLSGTPYGPVQDDDEDEDNDQNK